MVEQADPPGECGRDDVGALGRAFEAPKRILPVAAKPERLAGKHLVLWRTAARAEQCDRLEHRVDGPALEDARSGVGQHAGDLVEVADRQEAAQGLLRLVVVVEPPRCLGVHGRGRLVARRPSAEGELPDGRAECVPAGGVALELHEQAAAGERAEDRPGAGDAERLAERRREALEWRDALHESLHLRMLVGEDLGGQVCDQRSLRLHDPLERVGAVPRRDTAERFDRQPSRCGPPSGRAPQRGGRPGVVRPRERLEEHVDLVDVEREVGAQQLEHLALAAQPLDREGKVGARREHDVQPARRLPAERLDHEKRAGRRFDLVDVVDHEDEVAVQLRLKRFAHRGREAACPRGLVEPGTRAGRDDRARLAGGEGRNAQAERVCDAAGELRERRILGGGAVPGAVELRHPPCEKRRLAVACARHDGRQAPFQRLAEALEQPLAAQERRRHRRRAEPRGRGGGHACGSVAVGARGHRSRRTIVRAD